MDKFIILFTVVIAVLIMSEVSAETEKVPRTKGIVSVYDKPPPPLTNGITKSYYSSGELKLEVPYTDGKINGVEKVYMKSGTLVLETPYTNGIKDGVEKWYYKTGELMAEVPYTKGKKNGEGKQYNKSGELMKTPDIDDADNPLLNIAR